MRKHYKDQGFRPNWIKEEMEWSFLVGERTERFFTKEEVEESAVDWYKSSADASKDVLVKWNEIYHFDSSTDKILRGPDDFLNETIDKTDREIENLLRSKEYGEKHVV